MTPQVGIAGWLASRLTKRATEKRLRVAEQISLGPKKQLALVECDGRTFLVASGADGAVSIAAFAPEAQATAPADRAAEESGPAIPAPTMPERETLAVAAGRYLRGMTTLKIVRGGRQVFPRATQAADDGFAGVVADAQARLDVAQAGQQRRDYLLERELVAWAAEQTRLQQAAPERVA